MKSVIIISEKVLDLKELSSVYSTSGRVHWEPDGRLVVEGSWGWFAISRVHTMEEEYEELTLEKIRRIVHAPSFMQLEFTNSKAAEIAILGLPIDVKILIDNDHGLIAPIGEIRNRITELQDWIFAKY